MDDNIEHSCYHNGVDYGLQIFGMEYRTTFLYIWKFPKSDPPPPPHGTYHFGAFHEVENNFFKFFVDKIQEFQLILNSYGRYGGLPNLPLYVR